MLPNSLHNKQAVMEPILKIWHNVYHHKRIPQILTETALPEGKETEESNHQNQVRCRVA